MPRRLLGKAAIGFGVDLMKPMVDSYETFFRNIAARIADRAQNEVKCVERPKTCCKWNWLHIHDPSQPHEDNSEIIFHISL